MKAYVLSCFHLMLGFSGFCLSVAVAVVVVRTFQSSCAHSRAFNDYHISYS